MLQVGQEVYWVSDPQYIGEVVEIFEHTGNVSVQFHTPKKFRVKVGMNKVEITERQIKFDNSAVNLTDEELEDLKALYIELALQTNDEDWFWELTKK